MNTKVVDNSVLQKLLAKQRQDIKKAICTASEAMEVLGLGKTDFYNEITSPETKIVHSKKRGKFIWSSVLTEFKRIHGVSYYEATAPREKVS